MSDSLGSARPRSVVETPVAALVASAPELAKRWLIALIAAAPLEQAGRLPVAALAREAPELCARAVRALADDGELERLGPGGALSGLAGRAGRLAGAQDPASGVAAVESLRGVLWGALLAEMRDPNATLVAELASRLAHVCATITAAAVAAPAQAVAGASETPAEDACAEPPPRPTSGPAEGPPVLAPAREPGRAPLHAVGEMPGEGPAAWIGSIGRRLERYADDRLPFAVLLVEVRDIERLAQSEGPEELARLIGQVERGLSGELRPADVLTRESSGRYWLVTPDTDEASARMLAERLARAAASSTSHRGRPLQVTIGTAVCPVDGQEPATLAARADIGVYAARAAGRTTASVD